MIRKTILLAGAAALGLLAQPALAQQASATRGKQAGDFMIGASVITVVPNDGGSVDYRNRGLYNYQPVYSTPTTLKDTVVTNNRVHGTKKVFHDGGSIYNLSANPGSDISHNYIYDNLHTVGLYLDEGSRYVTASQNVVQDSGAWVFTNAYGANNTADDLIENNWYNSGVAQVPNADARNTRLIGNVSVSGTNWPLAAQRVIYDSGIEPGLRSSLPGTTVANPSGTALTASPATVAPGASTTVSLVVVNFSARSLKIVAPAAPQVPDGWQVTAGQTLPATLAGGASALDRAANSRLRTGWSSLNSSSAIVVSACMRS